MTDNSVYPENAKLGIRIAANEECNEGDAILLRGEYKVAYTEEGVPSQSILVPKHIVLMVTRTDNYSAIKPFYDIVVFEDDVKDDGESCAGHFNLNIFDHIEFDGRGNYYILCSLGTYLSNIVKVTVK